ELREQQDGGYRRGEVRGAEQARFRRRCIERALYGRQVRVHELQAHALAEPDQERCTRAHEAFAQVVGGGGGGCRVAHDHKIGHGPGATMSKARGCVSSDTSARYRMAIAGLLSPSRTPGWWRLPQYPGTRARAPARTLFSLRQQ